MSCAWWQSMFKQILSDIKQRNLYRQLRGAPVGAINFSSNDYLGLGNDAEVIRAAQAAAAKWGTGAGASRLVSGTMAVHEELERRLAEWIGTEAALVFPSGFQANLGVMQALVSAGDEVYLDRFVHASLVDGARLSGARLKVYPHRDTERLKKLLAKPFSGKRLIVTDSYFSMDGDRAPLRDLVELSEKYGAMLLVDEAHAVGVYGKNGRGLLSEAGLSGRVTAVVGTLSKSLGSQGGFVCGSAELRDFLINKARTFIYSTGVSPLVCAAALASLDIVEKSDELRLRLWERVDTARAKLLAAGFNLGDSEGPIIPIMIGDSGRAVELADQLREAGILGVAIRPPTVPKGTDRIRLTITAKHTEQDIDLLVAALGSSAWAGQ
jgi:8-amino-7-oxononanoate synthase